ncbi:MAG: NAD-dependent epimerase/dehydratase family protein [Verrucomicrobia bacterium]|nr:NAD-dependent epimerase/dehydratase family protein [Verrucomicrobiota bacterium]
MKILFLGGTGNISAECAALLHERGHEIFVVSRGKSSVPAPYRAIQADRKDLNTMRAALRGLQPDAVLNFIGYEVAELEIDFELFKDAVRQYLFISSTTVYAKPHRQLPLTEAAPLGNAYWDYAQKKVQCEQWLRERREETRFPVTIVRPSHTYSKRWIPNLVSSSSYSFAARLEQGKPVFVPDDGENPWTLTAASDFAVGLAGLVGKAEAVGEAFHITSDEVLTWNRIYGEIASALGVASPKILKVPTEFVCQTVPRMTGPLQGDKSNPGVFDNSKLKRLVPEFQCRKPFRVGIRESVAWLRAHPEEQNLNPQVDEVFDQVAAAWQRSGKDSGSPRRGS